MGNGNVIERFNDLWANLATSKGLLVVQQVNDDGEMMEDLTYRDGKGPKAYTDPNGVVGIVCPISPIEGLPIRSLVIYKGGLLGEEIFCSMPDGVLSTTFLVNSAEQMAAIETLLFREDCKNLG